MKKVLLMYYSKYGFTKKYAFWLAPKLDADIMTVNKVRAKNLSSYDTIILGSSIYSGSITGADILIKNFNRIKNKKLVIFTCGIADVGNADNMALINKSIQKKFPEDLKAAVKIFNLQGGINYQNLSFKHKLIMGIMYNGISHKATSDITESDQKFLDAYGKNRDYTSEDNLEDIMSYCLG